MKLIKYNTMKIYRFNEKFEYDYEDSKYVMSKNISKNDYNYISDFCSNIDYENLIEWISEISKTTKLKDFNNLTKSKKDAIKFSELLNIDELKKLIDTNIYIENLYKDLKKNIKDRNILFTTASNKIMYIFQEKLINDDFDNFFNIFIKDLYEDYIEGYTDDNYLYYDIHPQIMIKYGEQIMNHVETLLNSKKYNL